MKQYNELSASEKNNQSTDPVIASKTDNFTSYEAKKESSQNPTTITYNTLTAAFNKINEDLFNGKLPTCMITFQRRSGAYGYFSGDRFINESNEQLTDEIALNPNACAGRSFAENISTLAHEMCHLWQFHFSEIETRRGTMRAYHDKEWAAQMLLIGLMPTDTGKPNGKMTGRAVSHYIVEGGLFDNLCREMQSENYSLQWQEWVKAPQSKRTGEQSAIRKDMMEQSKKDTSKVKFTCANCSQNAWAKLTAKIVCGVPECHGTRMQQAP